jgi:hypothetical protein
LVTKPTAPARIASNAAVMSAQIHHHDVRPPRRHDAEDLIRIADPHRLEVRFCSEDGLETLAEDPVVVDDEEVAGLHNPLRASGAPTGSRPPRRSMIPSLTA